MKQHRFHIKEEFNNRQEIRITDHSLTHQVKEVLRLRKGDPVILFNGSGYEFHGHVKILTRKELVVSQKEIKKIDTNSNTKLHLFASLIKKDNFEWVLQKATELGVSRITPIVSERTVKLKLNMDRADKIVREAAEQSGRQDVPFLDEPITLKESLSFCEDPILFLHTEGEKVSIEKLREENYKSVFIGPEGGWGERDLELFEQKEVKPISFGEQVLRAETASISICSLILLGE